MWGIVILSLAIVIILVVAGFLGYLLVRFINRDREPDNRINLTKLDLRENFGLRVFTISILAALLLIPLGMVDDVVNERRHAYQSVLRDISNIWAREQTLTGPILIIPYSYRWKSNETRLDEWGESQTIIKERESFHKAIILPDKYHVDGGIEPEYRRRGIYSSLVYRTILHIHGDFQNIESRILQITQADKLHEIHWEQAYMSMGLSDPAGVQDAKNLISNQQNMAFSPGSNLTGLLKRGVHIPLKLNDHQQLPFDIQLTLKGSEGFKIAPVGERSSMQLTSSWEHPSFYGDLLPATHKINAGEGFTADWSVLRLVRSFPQQWTLGSQNHQLNEISFGVKLFEPVTLYTATTRAVKYGILFIGLTFVSLLLIEWITGVSTGLLQYFLIGAALSLFYLLLIALAEHISFHSAYLLAAGIVIIMIGLYSLSILKRAALTALVTTVIATLYAVLYLILLSEDYALLSGTILITVTLAASMYFTRSTQSPGHTGIKPCDSIN
jgi:inner membrane protein